MDIKELRERTQSGDLSVFTDISNEYGWAVYTSLSERIRDRDAVKNAYTQIMSDFYRDVREGKMQGEIKDILLDAVNRYCAMFPAAPEASEKPAGVGFWLLLTLLLVLNGICLWMIAGILMEMNVLPTIDLGYSWIKALIFS